MSPINTDVTLNSDESRKPIVVIGGGLAGLAAASRLAAAGLPVTILESRLVLGGRAGSFVDPTTQETVDNCQHVTMGCCTNLAHFCRTVGIADLLKRESELFFLDTKGGVSRVRNSALPAPLHQFPSFLRLKFLTLGEKLRIAWAVGRLFREPTAPAGTSMLDWLTRRRQTRQTIENYWSVVLVSALNESLDRIDYHYARQVFVEGFFRNRDACVVEIPRVPLGEFYGPRLRQWLDDRGVRIRTNCGVVDMTLVDNQIDSVRLRNGDSIDAGSVVLAVPFGRVLDLLPDSIRGHTQFAGIAKLEASPITSVHVWFDRPVMDWPHLVIVGRTIQWLFRRDEVASGYVQAVISASKDLASLGRDAIVETILGEMRLALPKAREAEVRHVRVVTERSATYSVVPGVDSLRPEVETPIDNLVLAGDYVRTSWPATMEGAVRGGYLAANAILRKCNRTLPGIEAPLPTGWLAKLLIR